MTEPTITVSAPAVEPWITAVAAVMRPFVTYALQRQISGDLEECRQHAGVSEASAELFEDALDAISDDQEEEDDDAAPDLPGSRAAEAHE